MAKNIALRRAAKAQRRKAIVAEKRRADTESASTAGQVRVALTHPIRHCLLSRDLFTVGMGMLVLARDASDASVTMATFLLDTYGMGVKDVFLRTLGRHEFGDFVGHTSETSPMLPIDPSYARKLLNDLVTWAHRVGFDPHPDYAGVERLFGTTSAEACDVEFSFGYRGKSVTVGRTPQGTPFDAEDEAAIDTSDAVCAVPAT